MNLKHGAIVGLGFVGIAVLTAYSVAKTAVTTTDRCVECKRQKRISGSDLCWDCVEALFDELSGVKDVEILRSARYRRPNAGPRSAPPAS